jgi:eukaryotic-like serine/threonine-protein kinase
MGEVHQARDARLGRDLALKLLSFEFASDRSDRDRFEHEARAVAYMVTELVDGKTLRQAAQIADGLAAAHAAGVTHSDVS